MADSIASNGYLVLVPDLFAGDAVSVEEQEAGLNLTEWRALHPQSDIEAVINSTIQYARNELGIEKVGGVGYCFGGKYVGRWLKGDKTGLDIGFVAHPSNLLETEIQAIAGPLSIAAGSEFTLSTSFEALSANNTDDCSTRRKFQRHGEIASGEHYERQQHNFPDEPLRAGSARVCSKTEHDDSPAGLC